MPRRPRHVVVAVTLAGACSPYSLGAPPENPALVTQPFTPYVDGVASVCVIRTSRLALAVTFVVHDNDVLVGATRGPGWFCYRAEPGAHHIVMASEDGSQSFDVELEERGRYHFDQGMKYTLGRVIPQGEWVDEPRARALIERSPQRLLYGAPATETLLVGTDVVRALPAISVVDPPPESPAPPDSPASVAEPAGESQPPRS